MYRGGGGVGTKVHQNRPVRLTFHVLTLKSAWGGGAKIRVQMKSSSLFTDAAVGRLPGRHDGTRTGDEKGRDLGPPDGGQEVAP